TVPFDAVTIAFCRVSEDLQPKADQSGRLSSKALRVTLISRSQRSRYLFDIGIMVMHYWHGNAKRPNLPAQSLALPCGTQPTHRGPVLRTRRRVVMETRVFGRTGMKLSVLGFGCGAVGGLMVRGDPRDQERTIVRAIDAGVNYFDTAVQYGDGKS